MVSLSSEPPSKQELFQSFEHKEPVLLAQYWSSSRLVTISRRRKSLDVYLVRGPHLLLFLRRML